MTISKYLITCFLALSFLVSSCSPKPSPDEGVNDLRIHDLQGCSHISPYNNQKVDRIEGIVTYKTRNGFYLQDSSSDDSECTSEAVLVFTENYPSVMPGDLVKISGTVKEFYPGVSDDNNLSITEIIQPAVTLISSNNPLPPITKIPAATGRMPTTVIDNDWLQNFEIEEDGIDYFESLESMLVKVEGGYVVGPRNSYNEIVMIPDELMDQNLISSIGVLLQTEEDMNPERIILNLSDVNTEKINVGDHLNSPVTGIMDYSYGNYKITVFGKASISHASFPSQNGFEKENDLRVATYNIENLSRMDSDSRYKKLAKMIAVDLNAPDILVLNEVMDDSGIEDDGEVASTMTLQRLVDAIESSVKVKYQYTLINPINNQDGGLAGGNIRPVILYRVDSGLELDDSRQVLEENPVRIGAKTSFFNGARKPLVALFRKDKARIMVIGVHLTSRGADSPLFGAIQPIDQPELSKRVAQAGYISDFVAQTLKRNQDIIVLVAGDINDLPWSQTVTSIHDKNLVDPGNMLLNSERFSYIFDGNGIQLDYIFVNADASSRVTDYSILHLNSIFDHTLQISDHDPVLVSLELN